MPRLHKLKPVDVAGAKKQGLLGDGGGLGLQVQGPDQRSWSFRYTSPTTGRTRQLGLGAYPAVSLARARERAAEARRLIAEGRDPIEEQGGRHAARKPPVATPGVMTFRAAAGGYIASHAAGWRSAKHAAQWTATLETYAYPLIADKPVADIDRDDVLAILQPIWTGKAETASRVRGRIEAVLGAAAARGWRPEGPNPATWRGHLEHLLPARSKVAPVVHHPALDWREAPTFMVQVAGLEGVAAPALRFAILTAARSGEVRGATWGEVSLEDRLWTVPGARMKARRDHRVPLSAAAMAVLEHVHYATVNRDPAALLFPAPRTKGKPLSDMALTAVLRRMNRPGITVHGFRSTFRDWAAEAGYPGDIAEAALAHTVGSKVEAAYRRGDLLERRRAMMAEWASYLCSSDEVEEAA